MDENNETEISETKTPETEKMNDTNEIRKGDGSPFGNKGPLVTAIKKQGAMKTHEVIEKDGGFIAVLKKAKKLIKCRIHRSNCDPENRDMPISVTVNSSSNKKVFWPGQEIELSESHINVLKDSVEEFRIPIPSESGIYASKDPVTVARNSFPTMKAEINPADNMITMVSRIPNYIIEFS